MDLGESIKDIRLKRGMTQKQLADAVGLTQNAIYLIEKGKTFPTKKNILKICDALDVKPYMILFNSLSIHDIPEDKKCLWEVVEMVRKDIGLD